MSPTPTLRLAALLTAVLLGTLPAQLPVPAWIEADGPATAPPGGAEVLDAAMLGDWTRAENALAALGLARDPVRLALAARVAASRAPDHHELVAMLGLLDHPLRGEVLGGVVALVRAARLGDIPVAAREPFAAWLEGWQGDEAAARAMNAWIHAHAGDHDRVRAALAAGPGEAAVLPRLALLAISAWASLPGELVFPSAWADATSTARVTHDASDWGELLHRWQRTGLADASADALADWLVNAASKDRGLAVLIGSSIEHALRGGTLSRKQRDLVERAVTQKLSLDWGALAHAWITAANAAVEQLPSLPIGVHALVGPETFEHLAHATLEQAARHDDVVTSKAWFGLLAVLSPEQRRPAMETWCDAWWAPRQADFRNPTAPGYPARAAILRARLGELARELDLPAADTADATRAFQAARLAASGPMETWTADAILPAPHPEVLATRLLTECARLARSGEPYRHEVKSAFAEGSGGSELAALLDDPSMMLGAFASSILPLEGRTTVLGYPAAALERLAMIGSRPAPSAVRAARDRLLLQAVMGDTVKDDDLPPLEAVDPDLAPVIARMIPEILAATPVRNRIEAMRAASALLGEAASAELRGTARLHARLVEELVLEIEELALGETPRHRTALVARLTGPAELLALLPSGQDRAMIERGLYVPALAERDIEVLAVPETRIIVPPASGASRGHAPLFAVALASDTPGSLVGERFEFSLRLHDGEQPVLVALEASVAAGAALAEVPFLAEASDVSDLESSGLLRASPDLAVDLVLDTTAMPQAALAPVTVTTTATGLVLPLEAILKALPGRRGGGTYGEPADGAITAMTWQSDGSIRWTRRWSWPLTRNNGDDRTRTFRWPTVTALAGDAVRYRHRGVQGLVDSASDAEIVLDAGEGVSPTNRLILFGSTFVTMLVLMVGALLIGNRSRARKRPESS